MICALEGPCPKTVCVAVFQRSQALQFVAASRRAPIVLRAVGTSAGVAVPDTWTIEVVEVLEPVFIVFP